MGDFQQHVSDYHRLTDVFSQNDAGESGRLGWHGLEDGFAGATSAFVFLHSLDARNFRSGGGPEEQGQAMYHEHSHRGQWMTCWFNTASTLTNKCFEVVTHYQWKLWIHPMNVLSFLSSLWLLIVQFFTEGVTSVNEHTWNYAGNNKSVKELKRYLYLFILNSHLSLKKKKKHRVNEQVFLRCITYILLIHLTSTVH